MNTNTKIKVIKKGAKNSPAELPKDAEAESKTTQRAAREMVATVTNWVSEFQQRRRNETKQAIEKMLFTSPTQTNRA